MSNQDGDISSVVYRKIKAGHMIDSGDSIVVGVSGGADSLCLLFLLCKLQETVDFNIKVVHVHHGIRKDTADRDVAFVKRICDDLNLPCVIKYVDVPKLAKENHETLEEAGRKARYAAFIEAFDEKDETKKIAVAHHKNDQAETIIHNMVRGSGIHGITGMKSVEKLESENVCIIRPLLSVERHEIEEYLNSISLEYCDDETNFENEYTRNNIRNKIIPLLNQINSKAVSHIADMADKIGAIEAYIESEAKKKYEQLRSCTTEGIVLDIDVSIEAILYKEIIRLCIKDVAGRLKDITSDHIDSIFELSNESLSGKGIDLPYNIRVTKSYDKLVFLHKNANLESSLEIEPKLRILSAKEEDINQYPKESYTKWFDYDKIGKDVVFRTRKKGDVIAIKGGTQKLQDFFTKQKIPSHLRDSIYLLVKRGGNDIIWVVGDGISRISEKYKVCDTTNFIMEVSAPRGNNYER